MAATDLLTLDEAKSIVWRKKGSVDDEALIQATLSAVSNRLDQACGPIVQRTVTGEVHDGGGNAIQLRLEPVASIQSIVEWDQGTSTTLTAESLSTAGTYMLRPWMVPDPTGLYSGLLRRRDGWSATYFPRGQDNVVVAYTAGRYATTEEVSPTRFGEVARLALGYLFKRRDASLDSDYSAYFPATIPTLWKQLLGADWVEDMVIA